MSIVISIDEQVKQREKDKRKLARVREVIDEHHKSLEGLYAMEREIVNRLGLNKPEGGDAA